MLRIGKAIVDDDTGPHEPTSARWKDRRIYRVEHANGPWLWLQDEESSAAGWVRAEWLVLYDQAIEYFMNELRANPGSAALYIRRGHIRRQRKEYDLAAADYAEAVRIEPKNADAYIGRGGVRDEKHEYDKAFDDYNEAIQIEPNNALRVHRTRKRVG